MSDMNMLASLKALLFSTPARGMREGGTISPAPQTGAADFAQLLDGSIADAGQGVTGPAADDASMATADGFPDPVPIADLAAEPGEQAVWRGSASPLPPGLALGLSKHAGGKQASSSNGRAGAVQDVALPQEGAETPGPAEEVKGAVALPAEPVKVPKRGQAAPKDVRFAPKAEATAEAHQQEPAESEDKDERVEQNVAPAPLPAVPSPLPVPVVEVLPAPEAARIDDRNPKAPAAVTPAPIAAEQPQIGAQDSSVKQVEQPGPAQQSQGVMPSLRAEATPTPDRQPAVPSGKPEVEPARPDSMPPIGDLPVASDAPAAPVLNGKPVKAEALALLQIVRDQVSARQSGEPVRVGEQVSTVAKMHHERSAPVMEAPAAAVPLSQDGPSQPSTVAPTPTAAAQVSTSLAPAADLSASLGAQVVDMGVSGQWIDGLARDIAGLSANGAQGRFQINAHQLGAVQVDIRQGSDGAAVNLTVASEAAEMALRQDSDRLKLDASLSAVRIAEVKIERVAPVAEAARADSAGQQSPQQQSQHSSSHAAAAWANGNQDMSQPQGQQGRWQARQNNGFDPKSSGEPAVLNHAEARQDASETVRARYA